MSRPDQPETATGAKGAGPGKTPGPTPPAAPADSDGDAARDRSIAAGSDAPKPGTGAAPETGPDRTAPAEDEAGRPTGPATAARIERLDDEDDAPTPPARGWDRTRDEADPLDPAADLHDEHHDDHHHGSFAQTALWALLIALAAGIGALWAAPRLAPHLPAPVARFLLPMPSELADEVAALRLRVRELEETRVPQIAPERIATIETRLGELAAARAGEPAAADALARAEAAATVAAEAGARATATAEALAALDARLAAATEELRAMSAALAEDAGGTGPAPGELSAAVKGMQSRIDTLATTVEGLMPRAAAEALVKPLSAEQEALAARLDRLDSKLTADLAALSARIAAAADARAEVLDKARTEVRSAALRGTLAALATRVRAGLPFSAELTEAATLSGREAPKALSSAAATGIDGTARLLRTFAEPARAAIEADISARSGADTTSRVTTWLRAQVTARPLDEQSGDTVPARLSRIEARLAEGNAAGALAEAEALPDPAAAAMGSWLDRLRSTVAAEAALTDYLAQSGTN